MHRSPDKEKPIRATDRENNSVEKTMQFVGGKKCRRRNAVPEKMNHAERFMRLMCSLTRRWVIVLVTDGLQMDGLAKATDLKGFRWVVDGWVAGG